MSVIFRNAFVGLSTSTGAPTYDISGSVSSVRLERKFDIIDITRQPDTAYRRAMDLEDWSITLRTLQSFSNQPRESGVDMDHLFAAVASATQAGGSCSIGLRPNRDLPRSATNPEYQGQCLIETFNPLDGEVGDLLITDIELIGTGDLIRLLDVPDDAHPSETLSVRLSESALTLSTIGVVTSDICAVASQEMTHLVTDGVSLIQTIDTVAIMLSETARLASTLSMSDTTTVSLQEMITAGADLLRLPVTENLAIALTESDLRRSVTIALSDTVAVSLTDLITVDNYADIVHVQSRSTTGSGNTVSLAFTSINTAESLLVARLGGAPMTVASISDTRGNTWQRIDDASGGTFDKIELWYAMNCAAGANTVTPSVSGAPYFWEFDIFEYSGVALSDALDAATLQEQAGPPTTPDGVSSGTVMSTTVRALVFANTLRAGGPVDGTAVAGTGFTMRQDAFGDSGCEDRIQAIPGLVAGLFTSNRSENIFVTSAAIFKAKLISGPIQKVVTESLVCHLAELLTTPESSTAFTMRDSTLRGGDPLR